MTTHESGPEAWLDGYRLRLDDAAARAERLGGELAAVTGTARSRDGAVTVTTSPSGALVGLALGPQAESLGREGLAAEIVATTSTARAIAAARAVEVAEGVVGGAGATIDLLRSALVGAPR